jgi:predicted CxxxxCH...CXXCH cytochrome family protein
MRSAILMTPLVVLVLGPTGGLGHRVSSAQPPQPGATPAPCGSCHAIPPASGAHAAHLQTSITASVECASCHFAEDFDRIHQNGRIDVIFPTEAGPDAVRTAEGCSNVYCHGNGRGRTRDMAWTAGTATCATCHDDDTTPDARLSGRHVQHLRIGVGCADCHGTVVTRRKTIADPSLHLNRRVDVKVLGGRYLDGSCQPACHEPRAW